MGREEHQEGKELPMIFEVLWAILSAHIQPSASELIGKRYAVHVDSDPKQPGHFFWLAEYKTGGKVEAGSRECWILNTAQFFS